MIEVRPISAKDITEGLSGPGAYCLKKLPQHNWSPDPDERDLQEKRQARYLETIKKFGTCGLLAQEENEVLGFITFFPKLVARRLGFYSLPGDDHPEKTLTVTCLHVAQPYRGRGIASKLVQGVKDWADRQGYTSIEAIGEGYAQYGWHASAPFLTSGFRVCRQQQHGNWCGQMMRYTLKSGID